MNANWRLGAMGSNEGFIGKKAKASLTSGGNGVQRSFLFTSYLAYNRINHSEKGKLFDIFIIIYLFVYLFILFFRP